MIGRPPVALHLFVFFALLTIKIRTARANLLATVTVENTRRYRAKYAKCAKAPQPKPRVKLIF
jgi:hypothetical protein